MLRLQPLEPQGLFRRVELQFEAGVLNQLLVEDDLQQLTRFEFSNILHNQAISPAVFIIEPAAGTDIIRN